MDIILFLFQKKQKTLNQAKNTVWDLESFREADYSSSLLSKNSPEEEDRDLFLSFFRKRKTRAMHCIFFYDV